MDKKFDSSRICGESLIKIVTSLKIIEANIGALNKFNVSSDNYDIEMSGVEYDKYGIGNLYRKRKDLGIALNKYFEAKGYENISTIVNGLCNDLISDEQASALIKVVNGVNSNKVVFAPFRLGAEVEYKNNGYRYTGVIVGYVWRLNDKANKLEGSIKIKNVLSSKTVFKPFSEYDKTVRLKNTYDYAGSNKCIVELTDCGLIKPVEIDVKDYSKLIIDNYGLFKKKGESEELIGLWSSNGKLNINKNIDSGTLEEIRKIESRLTVHRMAIAPHMIFSTNNIKNKGEK